jgi:hypothetical protein
MYSGKIAVPPGGGGIRDKKKNIFYVHVVIYLHTDVHKIIVWVEYFPYKYSFKVISTD